MKIPDNINDCKQILEFIGDDLSQASKEYGLPIQLLREVKQKCYSKVTMAELVGNLKESATKEENGEVRIEKQGKKLFKEPILKVSMKDLRRVVYFTDAHNQPKLNHDRFHWLSEYINEQEPDHVVDGGDFDDFESLCAHVRDDTAKGRLKDTIKRDLDYSFKARQIIDDNINVNIPRYVTLGNHEQRLWDYENSNPAMQGMATNIYLLDIMQNFRWDVTKYRDYLTLEGVSFTHAPMNIMNKPVGGARVAVNTAVKSTRDVCFGHTHVLGYHNEPKHDGHKGVTAFNGGAFMPHGYIPDYAQGSMKRPWYGCHTITILDGRIESISSLSILDLERKYGGKRG